MTATGHAVIGTIIAAKIGNPAIAIPIAILSHIAADAFPHWDTGTNAKKKSRIRYFIESLYDVIFSYVLSFLIIRYLFPQTNLQYAFVIIIAAQLLDWLTSPYTFFNMKYPPFSWVYRFQKLFDNRLDKPWGIIGQIAVLLFLIGIAYKI
jgi:hypothetical protein